MKNCSQCGIPITSRAKNCLACSKLGDKNPMWRGDEVERGSSFHEWVKRRFPKPEFCSDCKKVPPLDLANVSQKYLRDLTDWEWLCRKCHMTKDGRLDALVTRNINLPARTRFVEWNGRTQHLNEWASELNVNWKSLSTRIYQRGWSVEDAFVTPIQTKRRKCE